ncbi:copper-binding protein [Variovorax terrae]|uniref:Copper-binding protein n=1 Tax=Variovorax terrae TaxID=2923278 RepID=A0A9X1VTL3_9BURK|nr:copper-binding protein [Variovorax terrae]MCJ0763062.1 copper-binding protein [Variovorax terrae]
MKSALIVACMGERGRRLALLAVAALLPLLATASEPPAPAPTSQVVYTRAQVRALPAASGPDSGLLRLKIRPRAKMPFSTLTFQVRDAALLAGIRVGDEVEFTARAEGGENVLTRLRKVAPCVRFQPCPLGVE